MTDRHAGYVVTLGSDIREDDAEAILSALRMVKGVADVTPVLGDVHQVIANARASQRYERKVSDFLLSLRQGVGADA